MTATGLIHSSCF